MLKEKRKSVYNVNDRQRNVPEGPAQTGTVSAWVCCWRSLRSVNRATVTARKNTKIRREAECGYSKSQLSETKILNNLSNFKAPFPRVRSSDYLHWDHLRHTLKIPGHHPTYDSEFHGDRRESVSLISAPGDP